MTDVFTKDKRRQIMQAVRRENTEPETIFAEMLRAMKLRFSRHPQYLLGRPDFYFPAAKTAVFVHGCFWHGHEKCLKGKTRPKSNSEYWQNKIQRNKRRDRRVARKLRESGFSVYTVWACEIKKQGIPPRLISHVDKQKK